MNLFNSTYAGKRFLHFKGRVYVFDACAKHSETGELLAIYHPEDDPGAICARPLDMFFSPVDRSKYPDCEQIERFKKIDD